MLDGIRANAQSFGVKLAFGLIIIVFVFWGISAYTGPSHMVAQVNGKNISVVEFQRAYQNLEANIRNAYPDLDPEQLQSLGLEQQVLQTLVEQNMFELEAERTGIDVSPYDMRSYVEATGAFSGPDGKFDRDLYLATLNARSMSVSQFENDIRSEMLPAKFQYLVSAGVWSNPATARSFFDYQNEMRTVSYIFFPAARHSANAGPTEEELIAAYEERSAQYTLPPRVKLEYINLDPTKMGDPSSISEDAVTAAYNERIAQYSTPEQVKARHILIMVEENAPEAEVKKAEEQIRAIESRIRNGEDFATVAQETGQDGTAAQGGDLGWFSHSQMVPAFADAAFALTPGDMSGPVRSRFGFHLILAEDHKAAETRSLDDVRDELRSQLAALAVRDGLQDKIDMVLAAAQSGKPMIEAAALVKLDAQSTELIPVEELAGLGIPPVDGERVMQLPAGQVLGSALFTENGALVVKVVESLPQTLQPLDEVRQGLTLVLTQEKARRLAAEEAENTRKTFVDAKPSAETDQDIRVSQAFGRGAYIADLGISPELVSAVFALPSANVGQGTWLEGAYTVDEGAVLASLEQVLPPSDEQWNIQGPEIERVLLQEKANIIYYVFRSELAKNLDVRILNEDIFSRSN